MIYRIVKARTGARSRLPSDGRSKAEPQGWAGSAVIRALERLQRSTQASAAGRAAHAALPRNNSCALRNSCVTYPMRFLVFTRDEVGSSFASS